MRIIFVFFHFSPNVGGTEIPMLDYAKELVKRGHEVTVCTANALMFKPTNLPAKEILDGIIIKRFKIFPQVFPYLFFSPSFLKYILSEKADVIQVFSMLPSFMIITSCIMAKLRGIPLVLYPQYYPNRFNYHPCTYKKIFGTIFDILIGKNIIHFADGIVALTNIEANEYKSNKNKIIIYEPVLCNKSNKDISLSIQNFKSKFGINNYDKVIITVSRIEKKKGIHILINAIANVKENFPKIKLLVIGGDGGYLSRCQKKTLQLNLAKNVIFTGRITDEELAAAYQLTEFVVVPSFQEGLGRTILEAWKNKKAVIATKSCGASELITSKNGITIKAGDNLSLAYAIIELLQNPELAKSMGEEGEKLTYAFNIDNNVDKIESLYKELIKL